MDERQRLQAELEELRHRAKNGGYLHKEAFCLMKYATPDGTEVEWLWNSRDGVTPFTIHSRAGAEMRHVQWQFDVRIPTYQPLPGERIFVDITDGIAELHARNLVNTMWDDDEYPMSARYESKEEAMQLIVNDTMAQTGAPMVIDAAEWRTPK